MGWYQSIINEVLEQRAISSRGRSVPRGVRQRMSRHQTRKRGPTNLIKEINYQKAIIVLGDIK